MTSLVCSAHGDVGRERCRYCDENEALLRPILAAEVRRYQAQAPAIEALIEAADKSQCECTISQRESGHAVECWRPELDAALAAIRGGSR